MAAANEQPEWPGTRLANGEFLGYSKAFYGVLCGLDKTALPIEEPLAELDAVNTRLTDFINESQRYGDTSEIAAADATRDSLFKAVYLGVEQLSHIEGEIGMTLATQAKKLFNVLIAYKGVWKHELTKETGELLGFKAALSTDANRAALVALGLDKIADALFAANDAAHDAMTARRDERGERDTEKAAGTTPELHKTVASLLIAAGKRVNAVHDLDPDNEKATLAISKVCGIISDFKRVSSEAKHRKGGEPESEPTPEPSGDTPAT